MSKNFDTILMVGATSGLGAGFVRRFHAAGKTVIATGRRVERLEALQKELPGLKVEKMDVEDIAGLPSKVEELVKKYPKIDTVFAMAGVQTTENVRENSPKVLNAIATELTVNMTATIHLAHLFTSHLLNLGRPASFVTVTSGLAYVPLPYFPTYNATKAGIHAFTVDMRVQLAGTNVKVIELAPPYVDTELDVGHRDKLEDAQGGKEKAIKPMALNDYLDQALAELEQDDVKEAAVGFAKMGVTAWRKAYEPIFEHMGISI